MRVYHVNSKKECSNVDKMIKQGKDIFMIIYMEGCGPCNATRPEWTKMEQTLKNQYSNKNNLVLMDINKDFLPDIKQDIGSEIGRAHV